MFHRSVVQISFRHFGFELLVVELQHCMVAAGDVAAVVVNEEVLKKEGAGFLGLGNQGRRNQSFDCASVVVVLALAGDAVGGP